MPTLGAFAVAYTLLCAADIDTYFDINLIAVSAMLQFIFGTKLK